MWKLNKSIAKELLPTQPVDFVIEPWWVVCPVNLTLEEFKAPRKFLQKRKKIEVFKDVADESDQKNWWKLMTEIDEAGSAVKVFRSRRTRNQSLPKDLVLGTLVRFKQLKKWNLVSEMQRAGLVPDVVSYASLINAYGKARSEEEALAVFEEMLDAGVRDLQSRPSFGQLIFHLKGLQRPVDERGFRIFQTER